MHKILLLLGLVLATSLFGNGVHWAKDYKSGISQAVKEKKPVLFVISSNSCKYCLLLENTTLQDSRVIKSLNKDFVAVRSWTNKNDYIPADLARMTPGLPGIWFLNSGGTPLFQPILGYMDKDKMLQALGTVKNAFDEENKKSGKK